MSSESATRAMESSGGGAATPNVTASPQSKSLVPQSQFDHSELATAKILAPFDYDALDAAVADELRAQADRLRKKISKSTQELIEIGLELKAAKIQVRHGQFVEWVEAEVGIGRRTAQRYIAVAELAAKSVTVTLLTPTSAYLLSQKGVSQDVAAAALKKVELGELVTDHEVEKFVRSHQQHARMRIEEKQRASDSKPEVGEIYKHAPPNAQIDARSAALVLLSALGSELAQLVCETLAGRTETILAELHTLLRPGALAADVRPQTLTNPQAQGGASVHVSDAREPASALPLKSVVAEIPDFLDRRSHGTADEIYANVLALNAKHRQ